MAGMNGVCLCIRMCLYVCVCVCVCMHVHVCMQELSVQGEILRKSQMAFFFFTHVHTHICVFVCLYASITCMFLVLTLFYD